jgi:hypothetical protein
MPRIIRDTATAIGTSTAIVHTSARTIAWRACQVMMIATPA